MPSPFSGLIRPQTKRPPQRPEPIAPIPENQYDDDNFPYRGIETHGVESPGFDALGPDTKEAIVYAKEEKDDYLGSVRIVSAGDSREFRRFRTDRYPVTDQIVMVVGRNDERSKVKLKNTSADKTLYIAASADDVAITGYPLAPGESFETVAEDAIYAQNATDNTTVTVAVIQEYVTRG